MEEDGLGKPLADLRSVLIAGESAEAWAIQRRMFALTHRRVLVAATSGPSSTRSVTAASAASEVHASHGPLVTPPGSS